MMMDLSIIDLEKMIEARKISDNIKIIIDVFLLAVNDWPNPILNLEDYESEVEKFINGITSKDEIEKTLSKIDFSKNAWQAESLSQMLDVFQFYKNGISLKEIIEDLKIKLEKENGIWI